MHTRNGEDTHSWKTFEQTVDNGETAQGPSQKKIYLHNIYFALCLLFAMFPNLKLPSKVVV